MLLVSFIAGLGFAFNNNFASFLVKADVEKITNIAAYLRYRACLEGKMFALKFDPDHKSYSYEDKVFYLSSKSCFGFFKDALGPPSQPHEPIKKTITFKDYTIYFYPQGIVSAGTLYITDIDKKHCLYALSSSASAISYLRCYKYDSTKRLWDPIKFASK